jgi:hypothetical protein
MPIYKGFRKEVRWGGVFPGTFLLVLMIGIKCSHDMSGQKRLTFREITAGEIEGVGKKVKQ